MESSEPPQEDESIALFRGDHAFLSNFHPVEISWEGLTYPTVEHAFQAAKTFDKSERQRVQAAASPTTAKRQGRKVQLRNDWETVKLEIMKAFLLLKFSVPELRAALLATGQRELIEGNNLERPLLGRLPRQRAEPFRPPSHASAG